MESFEPFVSLAVALGVGLLIGIEGEQSAEHRDEPTFLGGARTHPLFALAGGLAVLLAESTGAWVVVVTFIAMMSLTLVSYIADVRAGHGRGRLGRLVDGVRSLRSS